MMSRRRNDKDALAKLPSLPDLYTVSQTVIALNNVVSKHQVYRLIRDGELDRVMIRGKMFVTQSSVYRYINGINDQLAE